MRSLEEQAAALQVGKHVEAPCPMCGTEQRWWKDSGGIYGLIGRECKVCGFILADLVLPVPPEPEGRKVLR